MNIHGVDDGGNAAGQMGCVLQLAHMKKPVRLRRRRSMAIAY